MKRKSYPIVGNDSRRKRAYDVYSCKDNQFHKNVRENDKEIDK
jgi:hypothetical protein